MAAPEVYGGEPRYGMPPAIPAAAESFPAKIRRIAAEQGWSEDFARYDDGVINSWQKYWDEGKQRFRSQHSPEGAGAWAYVEKPTESVVDPESGDEFGPWGDKIGVNLSAIPASEGGKGPERAAAPAAAAPDDGLLVGKAPEAVNPKDDLQRALEDKLLGRQGMFGFASGREGQGPAAGDVYGKGLGGGGLWWGGAKDMFDKSNTGGAPATPAAPAAPKPATFSGVSPRVTGMAPRMPAPGPLGGPMLGQPRGSLEDALKRKRGITSMYSPSGGM